jgi:outer membrane protein assembly factor BamB
MPSVMYRSDTISPTLPLSRPVSPITGVVTNRRAPSWFDRVSQRGARIVVTKGSNMIACRSVRRFLSVLLCILLFGAISSSIRSTAAPLLQATSEVVIGQRGDAGLTGTMPGAGPVSQPTILWEASSDGGVVMGMAIHNELLYFATKDPGVVTAVDRDSGAVAWTADLGSESTVFGPEIAGDLVVASVWTPEESFIVALDAASGAERWRITTENLPTAPTHVDGVLYVPAEGGLSSDASLYAIDAVTGTQRWVFAAPDAKDLGERIAVSDGIAVAGAWSLVDNGIGVYAIDIATGQAIWTFSEVDELITEPIVRNGIVLVTDLPRTWALDLRTGAKLWEHAGASTGGGVAMDDASAYFGYGNQVQAVSLQDGSTLWTAPVSGIAGSPTVAGSLVYTAVWRRSDDPTNHWLHAFDAASGAEVWSLELEHRVVANQPLAHDGVLYVDTNSAVVAFGSGVTSSGPTPPGGSTVAQGGVYTSAEFGYAIAWRPPWDLTEPQSFTSPGQDSVTLHAGDASLAIRATTGLTSPEEMVGFYVSELNTARPELEVIELVEAPELSRVTARFTINGVTTLEYLEVRPLPTGNGVVLTILTGPADWFQLAYGAAQELVSVDGQAPFQSAPAGMAPPG